MLVLYSGSGASDFEMLSPWSEEASEKTLYSAGLLLKSRDETQAYNFLTLLDYKIWNGTNKFGDQFLIMYATSDLGTYEHLNKLTDMSLDNYRETRSNLKTLASTVSEITEYIRFIVCELDIDTDVPVDWRRPQTKANNQNPYISKPIIYEGMRFSSPPEVEIAKALDALGIMYFPNCLARVGKPNERENRFPDFLICHKGKWGILEIDGQSYHRGSATQDHERSRLLEKHGGIAYFTRYDAMRCLREANAVINEFLEILDKK